MLSNALPKTVDNLKTRKKVMAQNINFDILFLAAREGLIDLEDASNILLSAAAGIGYKSGAYTQVQLDRKIRDEDRHLPHIDECALPSETTDYLLELQLNDLVDVSGLTALQEIVFRLHFAGMNLKNIAGDIGLTPARTASALRKARHKVRAAYEEGRYAGWYEVYLSEVNRTRKK